MISPDWYLCMLPFFKPFQSWCWWKPLSPSALKPEAQTVLCNHVTWPAVKWYLQNKIPVWASKHPPFCLFISYCCVFVCLLWLIFDYLVTFQEGKGKMPSVEEAWVRYYWHVVWNLKEEYHSRDLVLTYYLLDWLLTVWDGTLYGVCVWERERERTCTVLTDCLTLINSACFLSVLHNSLTTVVWHDLTHHS